MMSDALSPLSAYALHVNFLVLCTSCILLDDLLYQTLPPFHNQNTSLSPNSNPCNPNCLCWLPFLQLHLREDNSLAVLLSFVCNSLPYSLDMSEFVLSHSQYFSLSSTFLHFSHICSGVYWSLYSPDVQITSV